MSTQSQQIVPFKDKVSRVAKYLNSNRKQLALALPKHITVERMLGVALRSIQKNPKLVECSQKSLFDAILQSAQLGLECDGVLGQAYLIPFKQDVTLIPGYRGLLKLARNSGEISTIQAHEVYEKDKHFFCYGDNPKLEHTPTAEKEPGHVIAFYAVAKLKDGGVQFEWMWLRQVIEIRDRSQGYRAAKQYNKPTPWETDFEEMGKKTALRRLCKMLPSSTELQRAVILDELAEAGLPQDLEDAIDIPAVEASEGGNGDQVAPTSKLDAVVDAAKASEKSKARAAVADKPKPSAPAERLPMPVTPAANPSYAEAESDPFKPGGDLFGREPGSDDK